MTDLTEMQRLLKINLCTLHFRSGIQYQLMNITLTLLSSWAFKTIFWYGFVTHLHTFSNTSSRWCCTFQSNMMQWVWEDSLKGAQGTAACSYRNRPQTFVQVQVSSQSQGTQKHEFVKLFQTSRTVEALVSLLDYHLLELLYCKGKSSRQTPNQIYPMKSDFNPIRNSLCEYVTFTVSKG